MGISVEVNGIEYECLDYSVHEEATPLGVHDSSQSVGHFSVVVKVPEEFSPTRAASVREISNDYSDPYVTLDDLQYNPLEYQAEAITITDDPAVGVPYPGVRITKIAEGDGAFVFHSTFQSFPMPNVGEQGVTGAWSSGQIRLRGGGPLDGQGKFVLYTKSHPIPPAAPLPDDFEIGSGLHFLRDYAVTDQWSDSAEMADHRSAAKGEGSYTVFYRRLEWQPGSPYPYNGPTAMKLGLVGAYLEIGAFSSRHVAIEPEVSTGDSEARTYGDSRVSFGWAGPARESVTYLEVTPTPEAVPDYEDAVKAGGGLLFEGQHVRLIDTARGVTSGRVDGASVREDGTVQLDCVSDLSSLNSYRVTAGPSNLSAYSPNSGTLKTAVAYYASLAGAPFIYVDPSVADREVSYPGWRGESWYYLKQLAAVNGCEISFVQGFPVFRPVRTRTLAPGRFLSRRVDSTPRSLARSVEVVSLRARDFRDEVVMSPGDPNNEVLTVERPEGTDGNFLTYSREYELDLSDSSLYHLWPVSDYPPYSTLDPESKGSVFYTVEGFEDQKPPYRGDFMAFLDPEDSTRVFIRFRVTLSWSRNPLIMNTGLVNSDGELVPSLTLYGSGVRLNPQTIQVPTGVPEGSAQSEVGVRVESPFLTDTETAARAAIRASVDNSSSKLTLSGDISGVLARGDTGGVIGSTYNTVQALSTPGDTYAEFPLSVTQVTTSYASTASALARLTPIITDAQEFGNVAGARLWDEGTRKWFRITSADITPGGISFQADDDTTIGDVEGVILARGGSYQSYQDTLPYTVPGRTLTPYTRSSDPVWVGMRERASYSQVSRMGVPSA